jgi:hypothetical protein
MQMACAEYEDKLVCYLFCSFFRIFRSIDSMVVASRHRRYRARFAIRLII